MRSPGHLSALFALANSRRRPEMELRVWSLGPRELTRRAPAPLHRLTSLTSPQVVGPRASVQIDWLRRMGRQLDARAAAAAAWQASSAAGNKTTRARARSLATNVWLSAGT